MSSSSEDTLSQLASIVSELQNEKLQSQIREFFQNTLPPSSAPTPSQDNSQLFQQYISLYVPQMEEIFRQHTFPTEQIEPAWDFLLRNDINLCDTKTITDYLSSQDNSIFNGALYYYQAFSHYSYLTNEHHTSDSDITEWKLKTELAEVRLGIAVSEELRKRATIRTQYHPEPIHPSPPTPPPNKTGSDRAAHYEVPESSVRSENEEGIVRSQLMPPLPPLSAPYKDSPSTSSPTRLPTPPYRSSSSSSSSADSAPGTAADGSLGRPYDSEMHPTSTTTSSSSDSASSTPLQLFSLTGRGQSNTSSIAQLTQQALPPPHPTSLTGRTAHLQALERNLLSQLHENEA